MPKVPPLRLGSGQARRPSEASGGSRAMLRELRGTSLQNRWINMLKAWGCHEAWSIHPGNPNKTWSKQNSKTSDMVKQSVPHASDCCVSCEHKTAQPNAKRASLPAIRSAARMGFPPSQPKTVAICRNVQLSNWINYYYIKFNSGMYFTLLYLTILSILYSPPILNWMYRMSPGCDSVLAVKTMLKNHTATWVMAHGHEIVLIRDVGAEGGARVKVWLQQSQSWVWLGDQ